MDDLLGHRNKKDLNAFCQYYCEPKDGSLRAQMFLCEHLRIDYLQIMRKAWIAGSNFAANQIEAKGE